MCELRKILEEIEEERADIEDSASAKDRMLDRHWNNCLDAVSDIIKKHMDDEWILTEDRWPTKEECENDYFWVMLKYDTLPVVARCMWVEAEDLDGDDASFSEFYIDQCPQVYIPSTCIILAWRILQVPEPHTLKHSSKRGGDY